MEFPSLFSVLPNSPLSLRTDSSCGHLNLTGCRRVACCAAGLYPYHPLLLFLAECCFLPQLTDGFASWLFDDVVSVCEPTIRHVTWFLLSASSVMAWEDGTVSVIGCLKKQMIRWPWVSFSPCVTAKPNWTTNHWFFWSEQEQEADFSFQLSYDKHQYLAESEHEVLWLKSQEHLCK